MGDELKELGLNLRVVDVDELTPHPRNYNRHSAQQVDELGQSLDDFGQYKNVVAWRDPSNGVLYMLAGHGLLDGAIKDGRTRIVVNDRSDLTRAQAMALMASDNFTISTDFDYPLLADIVTDLEFPADVPGLGEDVRAAILEMAGGGLDYSDFDSQLDSLDGYQEGDIKITVPAMYRDRVIDWLSCGESKTAPGLGKGVMRRCGLL